FSLPIAARAEGFRSVLTGSWRRLAQTVRGSAARPVAFARKRYEPRLRKNYTSWLGRRRIEDASHVNSFTRRLRGTRYRHRHARGDTDARPCRPLDPFAVASDPVGAVPVRFVGSAPRGPHRADHRARVPDLGAIPHRLILPPRDSAGANGREAPGDLHSSAARRSPCVLRPYRRSRPPVIYERG